jgi:hypothetical protein
MTIFNAELKQLKLFRIAASGCPGSVVARDLTTARIKAIRPNLAIRYV